MIKTLILSALFFPAALFAQDAVYKMSPSGIAFMSLAWAAIITWNIICFSKILKNRK